MKNNGKENKQEVVTHKEPRFEGYDMEELRRRITITEIKRDFLREKAMGEVIKMKNQVPVLNGKSVFSGFTPKGVVGKLINGLSFADYILLGLQAMRITKKIGTIFKRK